MKDAVFMEMKMAGKVVSEARETKQNKTKIKCQTTCLEFLKMYFTFRPELVMKESGHRILKEVCIGGSLEVHAQISSTVVLLYLCVER